MKKLLFILFSSSLLFSCHNKDHNNPSNPPYSNIDCSNLPANEQTFAKKLSPMHKAIFCNIFTSEQRNEVMSISEKSEEKRSRGRIIYHVPISADAAVEKIIREARTDKSGRDTARSYYNLY